MFIMNDNRVYVLRPFRACVSVCFCAMGFAHRWCIAPFQGLCLYVFLCDGCYLSLVYCAPSGLALVCVFMR